MKFKQLHPAGTLAIWFGLAATSQAQLTLNYNFTPNLTVTDNGQVSSVQTLGGLSGLTSITDVNVSLNLTSGNAADPMYLGDIYSSLTLGNSSEAQRIAVLLNRAGRSNTDAFGSGLSSLNVTLDDSASTNVYGTSSSTGSYMPDGRLSANPNGAGVVFASGSNGLSALNGSVPTSDRVSLLVADYSQGGTATLAAWGLSVTGTINSGSPFTPGANVSINDAGTGSSNTVSSALDTSGAASGGLLVNLGGITTFSSNVTGSGGLNLTGTGRAILQGTNSYSGPTHITNGTLLVDGHNTGSGVVDVGASGTLGGHGIISGAVTVESGGTLSPGASIATLTSGALTLNSGSTFAYEMNSQDRTADLQVVSGDLTLDSSDGHKVYLTVADLAGTPQAFPTTLSLINYSGAFSGGFFTYVDAENVETPLPDGAQFTLGANTWKISYTATVGGLNVPGEDTGRFINLTNLTAIPEPGSLLALGSLLGLGLCLRRRK
ncbi:MAG: autotransporter-associated beta strand repeat-containing protein [Verrucomicrobiota bacterium]